MRKLISLWVLYSLVFIGGCVPPIPVQSPKQVLIPEPPLSLETPLLSTAPHNFIEAKRAAWKIHATHPVSFYCNCDFNENGEVQTHTCNYHPTRTNARTYKIEWEHIVPAQVFGQRLPCWREKLCINNAGEPYKGRACCAKIDKRFQQMEADLHNLVPAIGLICQQRLKIDPFFI